MEAKNKSSFDLDEKSVLKRAFRGERKAFSEIYDFYVAKIFRFAYLKTSSKETAEDLTSEVFLKLWKYIKENRSENSSFESVKLEAFIYKIARNLIIDFYRRKSVLTVGITKETENIIEDSDQDILHKINRDQEIENIKKSLEKLKDDYQEVIILRYVNDLSISSIAEITGRKNGSVRTLLHRAVKSLEKVVKLEEK